MHGKLATLTAVIQEQQKGVLDIGLDNTVKAFREKSKVHPHNLQVYVLCGDKEHRVTAEDLERIYWLRDNGYAPYVMLYNKKHFPKGHELRKLQRWVNNRFIFWKTATFEDYNRKAESEVNE